MAVRAVQDHPPPASGRGAADRRGEYRPGLVLAHDPRPGPAWRKGSQPGSAHSAYPDRTVPRPEAAACTVRPFPGSRRRGSTHTTGLPPLPHTPPIFNRHWEHGADARSSSWSFHPMPTDRRASGGWGTAIFHVPRGPGRLAEQGERAVVIVGAVLSRSHAGVRQPVPARARAADLTARRWKEPDKEAVIAVPESGADGRGSLQSSVVMDGVCPREVRDGCGAPSAG